MSKTPRCRFCGREHYGNCNPSLERGVLGAGSASVARQERRQTAQPVAAVLGVREVQRLTELQGENERQADEIKLLKQRIAELSRENEALRSERNSVTESVTVTQPVTQESVTKRNEQAKLRMQRYREKQKSGAA